MTGKLTVIKSGGEKPEILHQAQFPERIYASPALAGKIDLPHEIDFGPLWRTTEESVNMISSLCTIEFSLDGSRGIREGSGAERVRQRTSGVPVDKIG